MALLKQALGKQLREASRDRRTGHRRQVRRALLEAAAAVFLDTGYEALSMRRVALRAGYTATTIYRYFTDKDALLFAVVAEGFEAFGEALRAGRDAGGSPLDRIQSMGMAYVRFGLDHPGLYRVLFVQRPDFLTRPREGVQPLRVECFTLLREAVADAMAAGAAAPGDPVGVSMTLWAVVHGVTALATTMPGVTRAQAEHMAVEATSWCVEGIRP